MDRTKGCLNKDELQLRSVPVGQRHPQKQHSDVQNEVHDIPVEITRGETLVRKTTLLETKGENSQ
jgi:hypothetical protein